VLGNNETLTWRNEMKVKKILLITIIAVFSIPIVVGVGFAIKAIADGNAANKKITDSQDAQTKYLTILPEKLMAKNETTNRQIMYDTIYNYDTLICRLAAYQFVFDTIMWSKKDNGVYICKKFTVIIDSTLNSVDVKCDMIAYKRIPDETYQNGFIFDFNSDTVWMVVKLTKYTITHS
jgi:hypothetical protein